MGLPGEVTVPMVESDSDRGLLQLPATRQLHFPPAPWGLPTNLTAGPWSVLVNCGPGSRVCLKEVGLGVQLSGGMLAYSVRAHTHRHTDLTSFRRSSKRVGARNLTSPCMYVCMCVFRDSHGLSISPYETFKISLALSKVSIYLMRGGFQLILAKF